MKYLYGLLTSILAPAVLLYKWRIMRRFNLQHRIWERLGFIQLPKVDVWLHASSVGEINTVTPFIRKLAPQLKLAVSTVTSTGFKTFEDKFDDTIPHFFFALDLKFIWRKIIARLQPQMIILMERELWPNLIDSCHANHIKIVVLNARMPDKSLDKNYIVSNFMMKSYAKIDQILAQSPQDKDNFIKAGAEVKNVLVCGNLKFDSSMPDQLNTAQFVFNQYSIVWVAGSTHKGEDEILLAMQQQLIKKFPDSLLVLAPRHPQRFTAVWQLIEKSGLIGARHSAGNNRKAQVYLLDTLGDLLACYATADIVLVAGSLIDGIGGHNLLEPATLGKAVISGHYLAEFCAVEKLLIQHDALRQFDTIENGVAQLSELFTHKDLREQLGKNARQVVINNQGAIDRSCKIILSHFSL